MDSSVGEEKGRMVWGHRDGGLYVYKYNVSSIKVFDLFFFGGDWLNSQYHHAFFGDQSH